MGALANSNTRRKKKKQKEEKKINKRNRWEGLLSTTTSCRCSDSQKMLWQVSRTSSVLSRTVMGLVSIFERREAGWRWCQQLTFRIYAACFGLVRQIEKNKMNESSTCLSSYLFGRLKVFIKFFFFLFSLRDVAVGCTLDITVSPAPNANMLSPHSFPREKYKTPLFLSLSVYAKRERESEKEREIAF